MEDSADDPLSELDRFRAAFQAATGEPPPDDAFGFGDSPVLQDELAALVVSGRKRATAALRADLDHRGDELPRPGQLAIVLDGRGAPVCVIRTTQVVVAPFRTVDARFAWDEGEGDRSLEHWLAEHRRFFQGRCQQLGIRFSEDLPVVFERFEVTWPPSAPGAERP